MGDNLEPERVTQPGTKTPGDEPVAATGTPRKTPQISLPQVLIAIGCAAIIVSLFLNWIDLHVSLGGGSVSRTGNATRVPVQFLFDIHERDDDPTILILLVPAAALGLLGAFIRSGKALVFIAGGVSLFVAGMYAYQVDQTLGEFTKAARGLVHFHLNDVMGIAPYVCGGGALIMLIGAFLLDRGSRGDEVSEIGEIPAEGASAQSDAPDALPSDAIEKLRQLSDLRDTGVITGEQFEAKREELLRRI